MIRKAMSLPRLVITGASGFIGRHLLDALKTTHRIIGIARRSQRICGAPFHNNIRWIQSDVTDRDGLAAAFRAVRGELPIDIVIHLAAHYDFSGEHHDEYWRTNVEGLRHVLDECARIRPRRFIFASSVAACRFPSSGSSIDERSPADGDHIYAVTKRVGEQMLAKYAEAVPSCVVRFAALFSDWCEYPPLYAFLQAWLSPGWMGRVLGGRGQSAIPYLHIRDATSFLCRLIERVDTIDQGEVLIASTDDAVSHRELFDLATLSSFGYRRTPILMPRLLAWVGVWGRDLLGRLVGNRPFERPWMIRYIDRSLTVDASHTRHRLEWSPRQRLSVQRRMPFLIENRKTEPLEWHRCNQEAMKEVRVHSNLRIYKLLERHQEKIRATFISLLLHPENANRLASYHRVNQDLIQWRYIIVLRHLLNAIRAGDKGLFTAYCRDLAARRFAEGFAAEEVCEALGILSTVSVDRLRADPDSRGLDTELSDQISMTVQFGCDQIEEVFEDLRAQACSSVSQSGQPD